ncbi:MAG: hypothetical protein ACE5OS_11160 [Anaerolineae bacterium]
MDTPTAPPHRAEMSDVLDNVQAIIEIAVQEFPEMYPHWTEAQLDEPLLVYDQDGQPAYWKFLLHHGGYIIGAVDADVETGEIVRFGTFGRPLQHFPDPPTAEEALERAQDFLSRYADATIDPPFFCGRPAEVWLIRVRRYDEVIARVWVWGDEVWEGEFGVLRSTPTPP